MKKKILALLFVMVSALLLMPACFLSGGDSGSSGSSGSNGSQSSSTTTEKISIEGTPEMTVENTSLGYSVKIKGIAKNNTSKTYSYVSVTFAVFDADGIQLGTALDNVNDVAGGTSWRFTATSLGWFDEKPVSFKLTEITKF